MIREGAHSAPTYRRCVYLAQQMMNRSTVPHTLDVNEELQLLPLTESDDDTEDDDSDSDILWDSSGFKEADPKLCWEKAMQLLARQDYTLMRLRRKLSQRFTIEAVEFAARKAVAYGYLNDGDYAKRYINSRKKNKSRQEIRQGLWERGIRGYDTLLEELYPLEDEEDIARTWLQKRYLRGDLLRGLEEGGNNPQVERSLKRKMHQSLMRRGFSYLTVSIVLKDLLG